MKIKQKQKIVNIFVTFAIVGVVFFVGALLVDTQKEAQQTWLDFCDKKYGEGGWKIEEGNWEDRCNVSHHIGFIIIPCLGNVKICVQK